MLRSDSRRAGVRSQVSGKLGVSRRLAFCIARLLDGILCSVRLHLSLQRRQGTGYPLCLKRFLLAGLLSIFGGESFCFLCSSPDRHPLVFVWKTRYCAAVMRGRALLGLDGRDARPHTRSSPVEILLGARSLNALLACCWRVARSRPRRSRSHEY